MTYKLSPYQKNILDIIRTSDNAAIGNIGGLVIWEKKVSYKAVRDYFAQIVQKQPALRLQLREDETWELTETELVMPRYDFRGKSEKDAKAFAQSRMEEGFELFHQPLYEVGYLELDSSCFLFVKIHHLINDGASIVWMHHWMQRLVNDKSGEEIPMDVTYLEHLEKEEYVTERMNRLAQERFLPLVKRDEFPWKMHHAAVSYRAHRREFKVPEQLTNKIIAYVETNHISVEAMVMAAIHVYQSKITNSDETVVLRVLANRRKKDRQTVGCYANSLPQCMTTPKQLSFLELSHHIFAETFTLVKLAGFPFAQWVQTQNVKETVADISVCYRNENYVPVDRTSLIRELFTGYSEIALRVFINERKAGLDLEMEYQTDCYRSQEISALTARWLYVLEQVVDGQDRMDLLSICTKEEQGQMKQFQPKMLPVDEKTVFWEIMEQAERTPEGIALRCQGQQMTYREMAEQVKRVANAIQGRYGTQSGQVIAVHMERSVWLPVVLLAIWRCQAAFLAIPMGESEERQQEISQMCSLVLDKEEVDSLLKENIDGKEEGTGKNKGKDLAYLIFTSGTSGIPKAVKISHKSLKIRLQWMKDTYGCAQMVLQKTPMSFDVSVWELFLPLLCGKTLCLLPQDGEKDPETIAQALGRNDTVTLHFVPSMLEIFAQYCKMTGDTFSNVTHVICSGEALSPVLVEQAADVFPKAQICNFYGPAECTIDVSHTVCKPGEERVSIGTPVYNTGLHVVNQAHQQMPPGVVGELCITGDLVGEGYCGQEDGGFGEWMGEKAYFTGDYVRLESDMRLYYIGRVDAQVKLRGMRVDLYGLSTTACKAQGVNWSQGLVWDKHLYLFYQGEAVKEMVAQWVRQKLPYYYMPSEIIQIKDIPLTENGKLDQKALLQLVGQQKTNIIAAATPTERILSEYFAGVWKKDQVSVTANVWDYGLDSLEILQAIVACKERGIHVTYPDFVNCSTLRELAQRIDSNQETEKEVVTWLAHTGNERLVVAVPYAGGSTKTFWGLAKESKTQFDLAVVRMDQFAELDVPQIAEQAAQWITTNSKDKKIVILGCCVGSGTAVEMASRVQTHGMDVTLVLAASLPQKGLSIGTRIYSYWDVMTDAMLAKRMSGFHQSQASMTKDQIHQFRGDVARYLRWMKDAQRLRFSGSLYLIFGDNDYFTRGFYIKCNKWKNYVETDEKNIHMTSFPGEKHFFVEENPVETVKYLCQVFEREEHICNR